MRPFSTPPPKIKLGGGGGSLQMDNVELVGMLQAGEDILDRSIERLEGEHLPNSVVQPGKGAHTPSMSATIGQYGQQTLMA